MVEHPSRLNISNLWLFAVLALSSGAFTVWLLRHGYLNEFATNRWAQILMLLDAPEVRLENLSLLYPHIPVYLLVPFYYLPGLNSPFAPYLLTVLLGSALLVFWNHHLKLKRYDVGTRMLLLLAVALHPYFLWAVSSGTEKALSLAMFYLLCFSCVRMIYVRDVRAVIMLGAVLAGYFFVDERTVFLYLALLPILPFIAPLEMLRASKLSFYTLISLPLLIAIIAWTYMNWIFHGDPWLYVRSPESEFLGAQLHVENSLWLNWVGGEFFRPLGLATAASTIAFPALYWCVIRHWRRLKLLLGSVIFLFHPIVAIGLATDNYFLAHPADMLFLFVGASMAVMILLPRLRGRALSGLHLMLLISVLGGWWTLTWYPTQEMRDWRLAAFGQVLGETHGADNRLGRWLAQSRQPTLIDSRVGYRAVVARGDADGLLLPFMPAFKLALKQRDPGVAQLVIMNPRRPEAIDDRITQRYPRAYDDGLASYRLVYDRDHWRVYRRVAFPALTQEVADAG